MTTATKAKDDLRTEEWRLKRERTAIETDEELTRLQALLTVIGDNVEASGKLPTGIQKTVVTALRSVQGKVMAYHQHLAAVDKL